VFGSSGAGIVLGVGAIGDDKYLYILKNTTSGPETISLISVYLIECLLELNAPSFEFYMHKWKSIDQNSDIISSIMATTCLYILVYDLDKVVMDIVLVCQSSICSGSLLYLF